MAPTPENDTSGGSRLMGSNLLQTALDKLTQVIESAENKLGGYINAPTPFNRGNSSSGGGGPVNSYSINGNTVSAGPQSNGTSLWQGPAGTMNGMASGGNGSQGGGGSIGGGGTLNGQSSGGNGGWGGFSMPQTAGQAISSVGGALMASGQSQLVAQIGTSQYIQQQSLAAGHNTTNWAMKNSMGTGFKQLNQLAINGTDRATGNSIINQASGSALGNNARGRAMYNAANVLGYANPTMSFSSDASTVAGLYSNQSARATQQLLGVGTMNRGVNGQPATANSMLAVAQAYINKNFGSKGVSSANLAANLGPNGPGQGFMQYLSSQAGWNGQDAQAFTGTLQAYNDVRNTYKNYSFSQIQGLFNGAAQMNQGDIGALEKAGVSTSTIQELKGRSAHQSQLTADKYQGFNTGLDAVVGGLNEASKALNWFYQSILGQGVATGIGALQGGGAGASLSGPLTNLIKNVGKRPGGAASTNSSGSGTTGKTAATVAAGGVSGAAVSAVHAAESQIGVPYVWGGTQPGVGFDCSGLVQWAYAQAGIKLPRTSGEQWSSLMKNHSIPTSQAREGDLVFMAGSDGTVSDPGHVGMMVSGNMLIQAPYTGADVSMLRYDPSQWSHAARPTGPGSGGMAGATASGLGMGNAGAMGGYSEGGSMGSNDEMSALAGAMGGSAGLSGGGLLGGLSPGGPSNGGSAGGGTPSSASAKSVMALAKAMAAKRGWTGGLWNDLNSVEMAEAGWNLRAQNPGSKAFGIAQFINGAGEYASYGGNSGTAQGQITAFFNYLQDRYHGPAAAWQHEQQYHWYARGTQNASPGLAIVGENGPEMIRFRGGEKVSTSGQTSGMMAGGHVVTPGFGGVGLNLTVNFQRGSIMLSSLSNTSDVSNAASEISRQIADYLSQEELVRNIAMGVS